MSRRTMVEICRMLLVGALSSLLVLAGDDTAAQGEKGKDARIEAQPGTKWTIEIEMYMADPDASMLTGKTVVRWQKSRRWHLEAMPNPPDENTFLVLAKPEIPDDPDYRGPGVEYSLLFFVDRTTMRFHRVQVMRFGIKTGKQRVVRDIGVREGIVELSLPTGQTPTVQLLRPVPFRTRIPAEWTSDAADQPARLSTAPSESAPEAAAVSLELQWDEDRRTPRRTIRQVWQKDRIWWNECQTPDIRAKIVSYQVPKDEKGKKE